MDTLEKLYKVIDERKENPQEGSYTCYLFEQGLDKILKKIGEECSETIIAAKNGKKDDTVGEICDLMYHVLVMMSAQGITYSDVSEVLENRSLKIGNLKTMKKTDKLT